MALEGGNGVKGTGLAGAFARGRKGGFPAGYDVRKDKEVDPMSEEVATYINENIESGGGGDVSSVFGRDGAVTAQTGDYSADQVTNAFNKVSDNSDNVNEGTTNKYVSGVNIAAAGAVMDSDFAESEGFMRKLSSGTYAVVKTNLAATTDPGVSDDSATGYSVGSRWVNATLETEWVCIDPSTGAAVWKRTTEGTIFDKTWSTGSIVSSGTYRYNLSTGADLLSCTFQATQFTVTSGQSDSVTIGIYDGDPSAGGVIRYRVELYDITSDSIDDRNIWWMSVAAPGDLWLQIENFASTAVTLSVRARIKGD